MANQTQPWWSRCSIVKWLNDKGMRYGIPLFIFVTNFGYSPDSHSWQSNKAEQLLAIGLTYLSGSV